MKKFLLLSPEFGLGKGGIQTWAYYIDRLIKENQHQIVSLGIRKPTIQKILQILKLNYESDVFLLMSWKMVIGILPILFSSKKIYIFVHGNDILSLPGYQQWILKRIMLRPNIYFIANSEAIGKIFYALYHKKVDIVVPPFIDTSFSIENKKITNQFFTITRLVKRKNIANVIKALQKLDQEGIPFTYYIAGEGSEKNFLMKLVEETKLTGKINFLGRIDEIEKNMYLSTSSLFLLPSIFDKNEGSIEGYGIVFIEANIFGVPVISGNTGGMMEAVIDGITGYHTDGSVESIYSAIKKALEVNWDEAKIKNFSSLHHYLNQQKFLDFIVK
ncbi:MAG: glycosyltransferase family 4 protein [Campylobacterales bacterium]|nr:glycosyltransferase family 4 protein [Campylobacterales bacterium]HEO98692.1 glycosyltransferase [Campylobacterota bacterium]